jgi:hypothetical protein
VNFLSIKYFGLAFGAVQADILIFFIISTAHRTKFADDPYG